MKKYLLLLLLLPTLFLSACHDDDDDYPQVDVTVTMEPVSLYNGVLYIVKGQPFKVNSITVTSLNGENAALGTVGYYWNNVLFSVSNVGPYTMEMSTANVPLGRNLFSVRTNIFQVDKSIAAAWLSYNVVVLESADDLPDGAAPLGEVENTIRCTPDD